MKVLVTGADGYIGSLLAPLLLERGHEVVGLDTGFYRDGWFYNNGIRRFPNCINLDIRDITRDLLEGFDAVVHMAELSNDPLGQLNERVTYWINHEASVRIASLCKQAGVNRFVYTSSCSVYGTGSEDVKSETSEMHPQTAYARCKVLVEQEVSALADDDFSPTFLRNATAYGLSPRMRFDLVLNNLAGLAWTTNEIRMTSDGTPWRPLVHVLDICHAAACALEAPRERIHAQVFNVGRNDENFQVRDIAAIVARSFPECSLTFGSSDGDNRTYRVSFDKIHRELPGFTEGCTHTAEKGAVQLREAFERTGMKRDTFESKPFTRLKKLTHLLETGQVGSDLFWTF